MGISPVNTGNADESATASDVNVLQPERSVKPLIHGENGNSVVSELPTGTVTRDVSNSLASWTEEEQTKVRAALEENGSATGDTKKAKGTANSGSNRSWSSRDRIASFADDSVTQEEGAVKLLTEDDSGSPIAPELPGGTIIRDVSNSLFSWTEEQAKTRAALEEKGFAAEDIKKASIV